MYFGANLMLPRKTPQNIIHQISFPKSIAVSDLDANSITIYHFLLKKIPNFQELLFLSTVIFWLENELLKNPATTALFIRFLNFLQIRFPSYLKFNLLWFFKSWLSDTVFKGISYRSCHWKTIILFELIWPNVCHSENIASHF